MLEGGRNRMGSRSDVQLREDAFHVEPYCSFGHAYDFGDLPVRLPVFYPVEDRHLTQRKFPDAGSNRLRTLWGSA